MRIISTGKIRPRISRPQLKPMIVAKTNHEKFWEEAMSERTPIIAGNWKMYKTNVEAAAYLDDFLGLVAGAENVEIILCPSFTVLSEVRRLTCLLYTSPSPRD